jgi:ribosomal protein S12 methylthiotransferase accessory factor
MAGLDELKVPIWSCIRPGSRTVATSFGKGLSDEVAQISAMMEALEGACAENREAIVGRRGSIADFQKMGIPIVPLDKLDRCTSSDIPKRRSLDWIEGVSLFTGQTAFAPFELVGMDYERQSGPISAGFHMNSSGLGAGFEWKAAAQHAILELVEHEVTAMIEECPVMLSFFEAKTYKKGTDKQLDDAFEKFPSSLVRPIFREIPNRFGLSVVICELLSVETNQLAAEIKTMGFACRHDLRQSALAALLEAAQVRMGRIVGAREDIKWEHYKPMSAAAVASQNKMLKKEFPPLVFSKKKPQKTALRPLVDQLKQSGINDAWTFTLSQPHDPFFVVRALVDGLEDNSTEVINLGGAAIESLFRLGRP